MVPWHLKLHIKDIVKLTSSPHHYLNTGQASAPACEPDLLFCTFGVLIRMSKQASQHMWTLQPVYTFQRVSQSVTRSLPTIFS